MTAVAAVQAPLWTYALSLTVFGWPHVLVELRYVDERFTARVPRRLAAVLASGLAAIVALRMLAATGAAASWPRTSLELLLGCALVAATVPALANVARAPLAVATLGAFAVGLALAPFDTMVVFALLHNLTPLGFLAERLRGARRTAALGLGGIVFVLVPLLIGSGALRALCTACFGGWTETGPLSSGTLAEHLPVFVVSSCLGTATAVDLFAAGAYLQCMHYAAVLHVLPALGGGDEAALARVRWQRPGPRLLLFGGGAVLAVGFLVDFAATRPLYGIAAALHAWLEIPILLLACGLPPRAEPVLSVARAA